MPLTRPRSNSSGIAWSTITLTSPAAIATAEHFGPPDKLNDRLTENTTETCNTHNMLKLTRHLFEWHASAEYADYYERALYNHILASQNPDDGMVCYFVPLKAGAQQDLLDAVQ